MATQETLDQILLDIASATDTAQAAQTLAECEWKKVKVAKRRFKDVIGQYVSACINRNARRNRYEPFPSGYPYQYTIFQPDQVVTTGDTGYLHFGFEDFTATEPTVVLRWSQPFHGERDEYAIHFPLRYLTVEDIGKLLDEEEQAKEEAEKAKEEAEKARADEQEAAYERETYERLRAKFGS